MTPSVSVSRGRCEFAVEYASVSGNEMAHARGALFVAISINTATKLVRAFQQRRHAMLAVHAENRLGRSGLLDANGGDE